MLRRWVRTFLFFILLGQNLNKLYYIYNMWGLYMYFKDRWRISFIFLITYNGLCLAHLASILS